MRFNSKGQAFDVFKLLIAAVIAIAMLAILLPILQNLGGILGSDPSKEAANLVKTYNKQVSQYGESKEVTFSNGSSLNAKSIAAQSEVGFDTSQICLSKGEFEESADFEIKGSSEEANMILQYSGGSQKAKIGVVCDDGQSISSALEINGLSDITDLSACSIQETAQKYCVLLLRYA